MQITLLVRELKHCLQSIIGIVEKQYRHVFLIIKHHDVPTRVHSTHFALFFFPVIPGLERSDTTVSRSSRSDGGRFVVGDCIRTVDVGDGRNDRT